MYVLYRDGTDRFLGRYCGFTAPGPVESPRGAVGIRVVLHTDQENVASGFKARYIFEVAKSVFGDCGGNFSSLESGIITSPGYPSNYEGPGKGLASKSCNWYITARSGYKIFLNFELFGVEGDPASKFCGDFPALRNATQARTFSRSRLCSSCASSLASARLRPAAD
jgi:CUB domain